MTIANTRVKEIRFTSPLLLAIAERREAANQRKYVAFVRGKKITVPRAFIYNGASIPRFLWSIVGCPFNPQFWAAALVHDYLYSIKCNRKLADRIFKEMLIHSGVNKARAATMYRALRMFGGRAWRK